VPTPKLELAFKYLTAPQARARLGLSRFQFDVRIERAIFPKPTLTDNGVRYFDEQWIRTSKAILDNSVEATEENK